MRRMLVRLADLLIAVGMLLVIPVAILVLGLPIAAVMKLVEFVAQRL